MGLRLINPVPLSADLVTGFIFYYIYSILYTKPSTRTGVNNIMPTPNEQDLIIFMHEFNTINHEIISAMERRTFSMVKITGNGGNVTDPATLIVDAKNIVKQTDRIGEYKQELGILKNRYERFLTDKGIVNA